jgi:transaldolase
MLWASTGVKDPKAPADLYVSAFAAPETIDTMPEKTCWPSRKKAR